MNSIKLKLVSIIFFLLLSSPLVLTAADELTAKGTPVLAMWTAPKPNPNQPTLGFEQLQEVIVAHIFVPKNQTEAYNHCPELTWHKGRYHLMWINHPEGEDLPGQRILYSSSLDALTWSPIVELFAPPGQVKVKKSRGEKLNGSRTKSYSWYEVKGRLFAIAGCYDNKGKDISIIAREVLKAGFGPIFALNGVVNIPTFWPILASNDSKVKDVSGLLWKQYKNPLSWPTQAPIGWQQKSVDGTLLWEPTIYHTADGKLIGLWRAKNFCHRMYCSISNDGTSFPLASPTDIPDSPSLSRTISLPDGEVLLIGNQVADEFDNGDSIKHLSRDPLTVAVSTNGYHFERVYSLRSGAPGLRFKGTGGRGFQYPSAIVHNGILVVVHSVGKEDIDVAIVPLSKLGISKKSKHLNTAH